MKIIILIPFFAASLVVASDNVKARLGLAPQSKPDKISNIKKRSAGLQVDIQSPQAVARFYQQHVEKYSKVANGWTGSKNGCRVGQNSTAFDQATLVRINYYRAMAGVNADITFSEKYNRPARAAALVMHANHKLSHGISSSWRCFSEEAKKGAASSNLGLGLSGPGAIDAYLHDGGVKGVGHRVWLLHPQQQVMGTGSASNAHALYVFGDWNKQAEKKPVSWPPAGYVPYQQGLNDNFPWSVQFFDDVDHSRARVTMNHGSKTFNAKTENNKHIFVWHPRGLPAQYFKQGPATKSYDIQVKVSNLVRAGRSFDHEFTVRFIDPQGSFQQEETPSNTEIEIATPQGFNEKYNRPLLKAASKGDTDTVKQMLQKGADPNARYQGWTSLMFAAAKGHTGVVRVLVAAKANPNLTFQGWRALDMARHQGNQQSVDLLEGITTKSNMKMRGKIPRPR